MATINLDINQAVFYRGGIGGGVSQVVGTDLLNGSYTTRVARYTFTAPEEGALRVNLTFYSAGMLDNSSKIPLRFFIGEDPGSHANAGSTYEYTGELTMGSDNFTFTGEADVLLLPNTTYYLWVFPGRDDAYGCYYWNRYNMAPIVETSGSAGVIYLDNGTTVEPYLLCIDDGTDWYLLLLHVEDGSDWYMLS